MERGLNTVPARARRNRLLESAAKGWSGSVQCTESVSVESAEVMNDLEVLEMCLFHSSGISQSNQRCLCDNLTHRFGAVHQPCFILCPSLSLSHFGLNVRPEAGGKKLRSTIQRSTETGLAVEMRSRMTRQASRESTDGSMNSYSSEGK